MSSVAALLLGLVIGWLLEWLVDGLYWNRRHRLLQAELEQLKARLASMDASGANLQPEISELSAVNALLQEKLAKLEFENEALRNRKVEQASQPGQGKTRQARAASKKAAATSASPARRDDLQIIKGIGPEIAGKLDQAGIFTFAELAALSPQRLREILGMVTGRLSNQDSILAQARQLAERS